MKSYELIVVGGGPAGITLAKMLGKKMKMAIIRPEDHSMIYCAMPYAIEGIINNDKTLKKDSLVTDAGADLIRGLVMHVNYKEKTIALNDKSKLRYEKLVLVTGAIPFIPPIGGSELKGVMGFKTEKDLNDIQGMIKAGLKRAVVVGAGAIGIELAQALKEAALVVDLVDMSDSILPNLADCEMTEILKDQITKKGISLHLKSKVISILGKEKVEGVKLDNGEEIRFDTSSTLNGVVIFAVGMKAEIGLAENSEIEIGKDGIVVNDKMETGVADVYALGDCVQFASGITGKVISGKLATNAVPMAKILGFNLLGQNRKYLGFYNGAATKVGDFFIGGTGLNESSAKEAGFDVVVGYSELTTKFPIMPNAKQLKFKLIADRSSGMLLGAQILSGDPVTSTIDLLTFAIQKETKVVELTNLSYSAQPYQSFFPAANGVVLASEEILKKI